MQFAASGATPWAGIVARGKFVVTGKVPRCEFSPACGRSAWVRGIGGRRTERSGAGNLWIGSARDGTSFRAWEGDSVRIGFGGACGRYWFVARRSKAAWAGADDELPREHFA